MSQYVYVAVGTNVYIYIGANAMVHWNRCEFVNRMIFVGHFRWFSSVSRTPCIIARYFELFLFMLECNVVKVQTFADDKINIETRRSVRFETI